MGQQIGCVGAGSYPAKNFEGYTAGRTNTGGSDAGRFNEGPRPSIAPLLHWLSFMSTEQRFFVKQLAGEKPPSLETMRALWAASSKLLERKPWTRMGDAELVMVKNPENGEFCYCCVMGALGEVFCLHVFVGPEGYSTFDAIQSGDPQLVDYIYAISRGVAVELVPAGTLDPADKELHRALVGPVKKGAGSLQFRSLRPGFLPWYVNEQEARLLAHCVNAVNAVMDILDKNPKAPLWTRQGRYALMEPDGDGFKFAGATKPVSTLPGATPSAIDRARVEAIRKRKFPPDGTVELDSFYSQATIGMKHERKALILLALAVDANNGFVYAPGMGTGKTQGELLADTLLKTVESIKAIPVEVHLSSHEHKAELEPLAAELGIKLKLRKSLPALEDAKESILGVFNQAR